jgi:hypothetical protein
MKFHQTRSLCRLNDLVSVLEWWQQLAAPCGLADLPPASRLPQAPKPYDYEKV